MMSGRMAFSVAAVSIRVSPFFTEEDATDMFITSAPSRLPAISKEAWVRVEGSKNRLIWVRPRKAGLLLLDLPADLDRLVGPVEQRLDVQRRQALDAEEMPVGVDGVGAHGRGPAIGGLAPRKDAGRAP